MALKDLATAGEAFNRLAKAKLILGNDNHIGEDGFQSPEKRGSALRLCRIA
jgi:hypothetical protein